MSSIGILMDMRHAEPQIIKHASPFTENTIRHMLRAKNIELRVYSCVLDDIPVRIYVKTPPQDFERQRHPIPVIDDLYGSAFIAYDDATADGFTITTLSEEQAGKLMQNAYTYTLRRGKYGQLLCDSLIPPAGGYRRMHFLRLADVGPDGGVKWSFDDWM